jgi:hypothetical protein
MGADVRRPSCAPARREAESSHTGESRVYYRTIVDQQAKNLPRVQWVERQADGRFLAACARLGQIPAGLRPRNTGPANEMRPPDPYPSIAHAHAYDDDHAFSTHRLKLSEVLIGWLKSDGAAHQP